MTLTEILAEGTANDFLMGAVMIFGLGFFPVMILAWIFDFFVALKSPPTKRAAVTIGLAFLISVAAIIVLVPFKYLLLGVIAPVPGAIGSFLWYRRSYRASWYQNIKDIPEGVEMANDDWKSGILILILTVVIAIGIGLLRLTVEGVAASI